MDKQTLKALKGSIKKWERIVAGVEADYGTVNCPLCKKFNRDNLCIDNNGKKCPVFAETGEESCLGSPYADWADAFAELHDVWPNGQKAHDDETVMLAVLELEFLKSLLPRKQT